MEGRWLRRGNAELGGYGVLGGVHREDCCKAGEDGGLEGRLRERSTGGGCGR